MPVLLPGLEWSTAKTHELQRGGGAQVVTTLSWIISASGSFVRKLSLLHSPCRMKVVNAMPVRDRPKNNCLARSSFFFGRTDLADPKTQANVFGDSHIRKRRVVLKHHANRGRFRGQNQFKHVAGWARLLSRCQGHSARDLQNPLQELSHDPVWAVRGSTVQKMPIGGPNALLSSHR